MGHFPGISTQAWLSNAYALGQLRVMDFDSMRDWLLDVWDLRTAQREDVDDEYFRYSGEFN